SVRRAPCRHAPHPVARVGGDAQRGDSMTVFAHHEVLLVANAGAVALVGATAPQFWRRACGVRRPIGRRRAVAGTLAPMSEHEVNAATPAVVGFDPAVIEAWLPTAAGDRP